MGQKIRSPRPSRPEKAQGATKFGAIEMESGRLSAGRVPMNDFLRFLHFSVGKTIVTPSSQDDPMFRDDVQINMLNDVETLTADMAMSILEHNGYVVYDRQLSDGNVVSYVRHHQSRQQTPGANPREVVGVDQAIPDGNPHELITVFVGFKHADVNIGIQMFREVLDVSGNRSATGTLKFFSNPITNTLVVIAKRSVARHIRELARHMDVPSTAMPKAKTESGK